MFIAYYTDDPTKSEQVKAETLKQVRDKIQNDPFCPKGHWTIAKEGTFYCAYYKADTARERVNGIIKRKLDHAYRIDD